MLNNKITFFDALTKLDKKFDNDNINRTVMYYYSKKVRNLTNFILYRSKLIDFDYSKYLKSLKDYYINKKPLSYIVKNQYFNGLTFKVFNKVHFPRNETELLAESVEKILKKDRKFKSIIDVCCGTGNLGISIKNHFPLMNLTLLDIDKNAINNTKYNLKHLKTKGTVLNKNFFSYIKNNKIKYDVVLFNPPYVNENELDPNLIKYEDKKSFCNSKNPIIFYKTLFTNINKLIKGKHYLIAAEFGSKQKDDIKLILSENNLLKSTKFYKDLNNLDRFLIIYH